MIPVFDITRQNKIIRKELERAVAEVVDSGKYILGPKVAQFESAFAKYLGVKYAVGVASGTDAIMLALLALGIGIGDEVIMPANCYPSVFGVIASGATPRLVDIDPVTYNIDPDLIEAAITKKTRAILPVHLYGQPARMEKILAIAKKYHLKIIEDCAQATGAEIQVWGPAACVSQGESSSRPYVPGSPFGEASLGIPRSRHPTHDSSGWRKAGSIGDAGCFSFYPTKNLGAFGDGGMVVTNNREIYEKLKLLRMYGEKGRYNSILVGKNSRLDELQAAILLAKLKYLDKWNKRRREIAELYLSNIYPHEIFYSNLRVLPPRHPSVAPSKTATTVGHLTRVTRCKTNVYHLFVIRSRKRDQLKKILEKNGVGTAIHYPVPVHLAASMKYLGYKRGDFPQSEKACEEVLSLPMYPELRDEEVRKVVAEINNSRL